jgi:hypothetical protein
MQTVPTKKIWLKDKNITRNDGSHFLKFGKPGKNSGLIKKIFRKY